MKIEERFFWIAGLLLAGFVVQGQSNKVDDLQTLITTFELESNIQDAQISDFAQQLSAAKESAYLRGFENGKTQAASVLVNASSLYSYADGYHAAISQFGLEQTKTSQKENLTNQGN